MRILFMLTLTSLVRHFDSVILTLAGRGHEVRIATPGHETNWPLPEAMAGRVAQVTCPDSRSDGWKTAAPLLRLLADYQRYLEPPFLDADKLRARARGELIHALTGQRASHLAGRCPACQARIADEALARVLLPGEARMPDFKRWLRLTEAAIPSDPAFDRFLSAERPDVVLVTPLVGFGSEQADWVKSARTLRIPVGFPVFSWDNLTTKGLVHEQPDAVFVWNEVQQREAVAYHDVPPERIVITGAPRFDAFCRLTPKRDRAGFCEKYGLRADRPIVAYLCSSDFVAEREAAFVATWIDEVRRDPALAECNIVIRPHPRSEVQWSEADLGAWPHVAVTMPKTMNADRLLYDTLFHSAAVVGLNTSAQIEAALLGKPVLTLLAPGFERGQQGTLHFRYLLESDGGFVQVAEDMAAHRAQLRVAVEGRHDGAATRAFVERFVRPAGIDRPATPVVADAIERLGRRGGLASAFRRWRQPRQAMSA